MDGTRRRFQVNETDSLCMSVPTSVCVCVLSGLRWCRRRQLLQQQQQQQQVGKRLIAIQTNRPTQGVRNRHVTTHTFGTEFSIAGWLPVQLLTT